MASSERGTFQGSRIAEQHKDNVKTWQDFNAAIAAGQKPEKLLGLDDMLHSHHDTPGNSQKRSFEEKLTVTGISEMPLQYRYSRFRPTDLPSCREPLKLEMVSTPPHLPITQLLGPCCLDNSESTSKSVKEESLSTKSSR